MSELLVMTRPQPCLSAGAASLLGSYLAGVELTQAAPWFAALTVVLIVACCNLVNDIIDAEVDSVDRPDRPLAAGTVEVAHVWMAALMLVIGGMVFAAQLGPGAVIAAFSFLLAGFAYSVVLRRVPLLGHVWVALLFGATAVWGAWATGGTVTKAAWMAGGLVALFLLPRELLKSIGDVRGDRLAGWRTSAVVWGRQRTVMAISLTAVLFAVLTLVPVLGGIGGVGFLSVIWLGAVLPMFALVVWLWRHPDGEMRRAEFLSGLLWLPGLVALWLLGPGS